MKSEYLLFNVIVAFGPILSLLFIPNIRKPQVLPALLAIISTALAFIVWDIAVTGIFWNFNSAFILGPRIGLIPFEEALFFITVPLGCLVLWVNWNQIHNGSGEMPLVPITLGLIATPISLWSLLVGWYYTGAVWILLLVTLAVDHLIKRELLWKSKFQSFSLFVLLLTFIFNLYLTARPIVLYNSAMKSNINILTIPVEDFTYGLVLIYIVILIYEKFAQKLGQVNKYAMKRYFRAKIESAQ